MTASGPEISGSNQTQLLRLSLFPFNVPSSLSSNFMVLCDPDTREVVGCRRRAPVISMVALGLGLDQTSLSPLELQNP